MGRMPLPPRRVILCNENPEQGWTRQRLKGLSALQQLWGAQISAGRLIGARWDSAGASALRQGVGEGGVGVSSSGPLRGDSSLSLQDYLIPGRRHPIRLPAV